MENEILNVEKVKNSFIYDKNRDINKIKNLLLIDSDVQDHIKFYENSNNSTYPIIYTYNSDKEELKEILKNIISLKRLAILTHNSNLNKGKNFLNNKNLFTEEDLKKNVNVYSENMQFIIDLINTYKITNYDYLACETLNYSIWNTYYEILKNETNVIVGASNDKTGNLKYGGNWIMESTGINIENIYFTPEIESYAYTLAATSIIAANILIQQSGLNIQYSIDSGTSWIDITFPCTVSSISQTTSCNIIFTTDLIISSTQGVSGYFIIGSNKINIDGQSHIVTVIDIINYPGLILNENSYTNILIKNIGIISSGSTTLQNFQGWLCQKNFGPGISNGTITVTNCYSNGIISSYGGGIFGLSAIPYSSGGSIIVSKCYSSGRIGQFAGGIFGETLGQSSSNIIITVTNCYSSGLIDVYGGGIFGRYMGFSMKGQIITTNCYSTGSIGSKGGGIFAYLAGGFAVASTIISAENCYSTGSIETSGGGIYGDSVGYSTTPISNVTITAKNCYSTGTIGTNGGGIYGDNTIRTSISNITIIAENCYTIGTISTIGNGIYGSNNDIGITTNCLASGNNTWNSSNATLYLIPNTAWVTGTITPWLLSSYNAELYNPSTINTYGSGSSNAGLFLPGYTYKFSNTTIIPLNTTINSSTGVVSFTNLSVGTYNIGISVYKLSNNNYITYNSNNLIINSISYPCFKIGSKILTDKGYIAIEYLRNGDLIKTLKNGYLPIVIIGKSEIYNSGNGDRIKNRLYNLSCKNYSDLSEDLVLTGCHSILVDFITEYQLIEMGGEEKRLYITDDKVRLFSYLDPNAIPYEKEGTFTIYHIALENKNYYENYGIYANGLLVESCSIRYLKELSNMTLIE
jgi:hypothetical protein